MIKYCRTYIRLFKIVRTYKISIMDHEIISTGIDGSCDVYSSLKFAYPLAENGLLICTVKNGVNSIHSQTRLNQPPMVYSKGAVYVPSSV